MSRKHVIIVDDDPFSNMLCRYMLEESLDAEVVEFTNPEHAIAYISSTYKTVIKKRTTILLLDINMPEMTGWDFLKWFGTTSPHIREQISIYMTSSSVDARDMERAAESPYVKGFLTKPLNMEMIGTI